MSPSESSACVAVSSHSKHASLVCQLFSSKLQKMAHASLPTVSDNWYYSTVGHYSNGGYYSTALLCSEMQHTKMYSEEVPNVHFGYVIQYHAYFRFM